MLRWTRRSRMPALSRQVQSAPIICSGEASARTIVEAADITHSGKPKRSTFAVPKAMSSTVGDAAPVQDQGRIIRFAGLRHSNRCIGNAYETIQIGKQDIFAGGRRADRRQWCCSTRWARCHRNRTIRPRRPPVRGPQLRRFCDCRRRWRRRWRSRDVGRSVWAGEIVITRHLRRLRYGCAPAKARTLHEDGDGDHEYQNHYINPHATRPAGDPPAGCDPQVLDRRKNARRFPRPRR